MAITLSISISWKIFLSCKTFTVSIVIRINGTLNKSSGLIKIYLNYFLFSKNSCAYTNMGFGAKLELVYFDFNKNQWPQMNSLINFINRFYTKRTTKNQRDLYQEINKSRILNLEKLVLFYQCVKITWPPPHSTSSQGSVVWKYLSQRKVSWFAPLYESSSIHTRTPSSL